MKTIKLCVLTKSDKNKKYCVAGVDCNSGKWIRLVTTDSQSDGAVSKDFLTDKYNNECQLLDIIEVPVIGHLNNKLQPENILIDQSQSIHIIEKNTLKKVLDIHPPETKINILGNKYSSIPEYILQKQGGSLGYSLILVKVNKLLIKQTTNPEGKPKTKVDFFYQCDKYENLSVTDSRFYSLPNNTYFETAILVISIGTTKYNNKYFKFVSAIYPNH